MTEIAQIAEPTLEDLKTERAALVAAAAESAAQSVETRARISALYADHPEHRARLLASHDARADASQALLNNAIAYIDLAVELTTP